jgi:hypothetical protein
MREDHGMKKRSAQGSPVPRSSVGPVVTFANASHYVQLGRPRIVIERIRDVSR